MGLRDIVGSLGIIPKMLARKDQEKSDEISRLKQKMKKPVAWLGLLWIQLLRNP
jgi:hypothetical protein